MTYQPSPVPGGYLPSEEHPRVAFERVADPADPTVPSAGVLVMHGFTGAVFSVRDWALSLTPQHAVAVPALPGHTDDDDAGWQQLGATTWQDWYDHAAAHVRNLAERHDRVVVAGLSMGGALALRLAQTLPDVVAGVVVVNPALSLHNRAARGARVAQRVLKTTAGIGSDIAKSGVNEYAYPRTPLAGVAQLNDLMKITTKDLGRITAPVLLLRARQDHVVSDAAHERIMRGCSGPVETVVLPRSFHVTTLDHEAEVVNARTRAFVDAVADGRCPITGLPLESGPVNHRHRARHGGSTA